VASTTLSCAMAAKAVPASGVARGAGDEGDLSHRFRVVSLWWAGVLPCPVPAARLAGFIRPIGSRFLKSICCVRWSHAAVLDKSRRAVEDLAATLRLDLAHHPYWWASIFPTGRKPDRRCRLAAGRRLVVLQHVVAKIAMWRSTAGSKGCAGDLQWSSAVDLKRLQRLGCRRLKAGADRRGFGPGASGERSCRRAATSARNAAIDPGATIANIACQSGGRYAPSVA
jgi:hypothetical protein